MPRLRIIVVLFMLAVSGLARAQSQESSGPPSVDILGSHDDNGRGCVGCHAAHKEINESRAQLLWGSMDRPDYGEKLLLADGLHAAEVQANKLATEAAEVDGVVLCLSCHDGNLTPISMVVGPTYSERIGLMSGLRHSRVHFISDEAGNVFGLEHPLGVGATIEVGDGLKFANGVFSVTPGTPYAEFVANYGWPTLAPMRRVNPYGIDAEGKPYLVCTTCHNQHAMNVYRSRPGSRIAGDNGDESYTSAAFVNGPYNTNVTHVDNRNAGSSEQFCRQCHFHLTNESNNTKNIRTEF